MHCVYTKVNEETHLLIYVQEEAQIAELLRHAICRHLLPHSHLLEGTHMQIYINTTVGIYFLIEQEKVFSELGLQ